MGFYQSAVSSVLRAAYRRKRVAVKSAAVQHGTDRNPLQNLSKGPKEKYRHEELATELCSRSTGNGSYMLQPDVTRQNARPLDHICEFFKAIQLERKVSMVIQLY